MMPYINILQLSKPPDSATTPIWHHLAPAIVPKNHIKVLMEFYQIALSFMHIILK